MLNGKYSLTEYIIICGIAMLANAGTITMDELAIWSGSTIRTGSGVAITGPIASLTGVSINKDSKVNSIYTTGSICLGSKAKVSGDAIAGGKISVSKKAVITGDSKSLASIELPKLNYLTQNVIGNNSVYTQANSNTILNPGDYSSWSLSSKNTVNLSAGSYNLKSLWIGSTSVVNVDTSTGDVVLNVAGNFSVGRDVKFVSSGQGALKINVFKSNARFDNGSSMTGQIRVFSGGLSTGSSVNLMGSIYATGDVCLGSNTSVTYASFANTGSIPEPTSLAIFSVMGTVLFFRGKGQAAKGTSTEA